MFAGGQRPQREFEMEPGRHRDDYGVDGGIVDRRIVGRIAPCPAETPAELVRASPLAAGVAAGDVGGQGFEVPAVDTGDETTAQEGDADGSHSVVNRES